jgi:hypothetical protein
MFSPCAIDELMFLYVVVCKIKVSPFKSIIMQWLMNYKMMGPIECMSLITRIVSRLGILEGKVVPVIHGDRSLIDKAYLIQGIYLRAV